MTSNSDPKRDLLRHTLATLAYRGGNAVRNAPAGFAETRSCESGRTAAQILAHIGDLLEWALSIAQGKQSWNSSDPLSWEKETDRFFAALKRFDYYLASAEPLHVQHEKLVQVPLAAAKATNDAINAAIAGFRRTHFPERVSGPARRA